MVDAHRLSGSDATLAVVPNPAPENFNGIAVDDDGRITGFVPKGQAQDTWHFIGVQIVQASLFSDLPDGVAAETVHGFYRDMIAVEPGRLRVWKATPRRLHHIGTPREYLDAALAMEGPFVAAEGVTSSIVWPGTRVGSGVELHACLAAGLDEIPAGFRATNALLMPASVVAAGDQVDVTDGVAVFPLPPSVIGPTSKR